MTDQLRVSAAKVVVLEQRPPLIGLTLETPAPAREYQLDAWTAFEIAHGMAQLAMRLDPTIEAELRRRMLTIEGPS